jgi:hypothetical protein
MHAMRAVQRLSGYMRYWKVMKTPIRYGPYTSMDYRLQLPGGPMVPGAHVLPTNRPKTSWRICY